MEQIPAADTPPEPHMAKRVVKRVSSTRRGRRPKQGGQPPVPETVDLMTATDNAPAEAAGGPAPAGHGRVVLGACCTIHEAPAIRAHLLEQAALPGPYQIDGASVQQVDTAGVQLLVAFALDCLERSIHYVWTGRSPALEEAIRTLGVGALLESPGAGTYSVGGK